MAGVCRSLRSIGWGSYFLGCLCIILGVFPLAFALKFTVEPKATTVDIGQQATLTCTAVQGSDKITYTWNKDGTKVITNARITVGSDGTLSISKTEVDDKGSYVCLAKVDGQSNPAKTNAAKLSIRNICKSPAVSSKPSGKTKFDLKKTVTLRCQCRNSFPKPEYKWTKDAATVQQNNRVKQVEKKLVIDNANYYDSGSYACEAKNQIGDEKTTNPYNITVGDPFIKDIIFKDNPYIVKKGLPLNIECKPDAYPEAKIEWRKADGSQLPKKFGISGCCTLQNNATSLGDAAEFNCTASNSAGNKIKTIKVVVATLPEFILKPQHQFVKEGQEVTLKCTVKGTPQPKVIWKKGDEMVTDDGQYKVLNDSLLIMKAEIKHTGIYTCRAFTSGTQWYIEEKATITVLGEVKVDKFHVYEKQFDRGKLATIFCRFQGYQGKVEWRKLGMEKLPAKMGTNSLVFEKIDYEDEGMYICTGSNYFSNASSYVNVSVSEFPKFVVEPKNTTARAEETVWLHCNATGKPRPRISWGKLETDGDKLPKERFVKYSNGTLQIKNLKLDDDGIYFCLAAANGKVMQANMILRVKFSSMPTEPIPSEKSSESMGRTIGIAVGCAAAYIVLVVGLMIYCKSRRARQQRREKTAVEIPINIDREDGDGNDMTLNPVYRRGASYDKMEFPRHDIEALRTLGNGSYGRAFLARASGIRDGEKETMVVVKALMSKDDIVREEFNKEMEMLTSMENSNVVTLLGVCKEIDPFYMIFEYTEKGDLKQFLLASHDNGHSKLNSTQKLAMCSEVANGMSYLAAHGFAHKDLASRNCMVTKNLQVKIGLLSLSYDLYNAEYYRFNNVLIPLRWMAPEAIFHDEYSEKSDVWSYAVFMWEVYSLGEMPYHGRSDEEVLKCVRDDLRLSKPEICPENIVELMEKCWEGNPLARPTFSEIINEISGIAVDSHV